METKDNENTNTTTRRANIGKWVECLKMKLGWETYDTQFTTSNEKNKNILCMTFKNYPWM